MAIVNFTGNDNLDTFACRFATAVMQAALDELRVVGRAGEMYSEARAEELITFIRPEARAALDVFLSGGKALADTGNAGWLEALFITETREAGKRAARAYMGAA